MRAKRGKVKRIPLEAGGTKSRAMGGNIKGLKEKYPELIKRIPARYSLEDVLRHAIERGDIKMVREAVKRGARTTSKDYGGFTAYELAIRKHGFQNEIVDILEKARARENKGQPLR